MIFGNDTTRSKDLRENPFKEGEFDSKHDPKVIFLSWLAS